MQAGRGRLRADHRSHPMRGEGRLRPGLSLRRLRDAQAKPRGQERAAVFLAHEGIGASELAGLRGARGRVPRLRSMRLRVPRARDQAQKGLMDRRRRAVVSVANAGRSS